MNICLYGVNVVVESAIACEVLKTIEQTENHIEFLNSHSYKENDGYSWKALSDLMDKAMYEVEGYVEYADLIESCYWRLESADSIAYRRTYEDEFSQYRDNLLKKAKDGTLLSSDLDFYSDWSKDLYGFRDRSLGYLYEVAINDYTD